MPDTVVEPQKKWQRLNEVHVAIYFLNIPYPNQYLVQDDYVSCWVAWLLLRKGVRQGILTRSPPQSKFQLINFFLCREAEVFRKFRG